MLGHWILGLQVLVVSAFAGSESNHGFCFGEHLPGYYAVIRKTSTDPSKIGKNDAPLVLSTNGLSGVKNGLFIGVDGAYLDKNGAEKVLVQTRKASPDAYVKFLGSYSNLPGAVPQASCRNGWIHSQQGKVIRGCFLPGKGWLLEQSGTGAYLVESKGEPAEDELCVNLAPTSGWVVSESTSSNECCTDHRFRLVSFEGKLTDETTVSIDDGPTYKTVEILEDSAGGPRVVVTSNGKIETEWFVSGSKFTKSR